jgi:hypothetical protein
MFVVEWTHRLGENNPEYTGVSAIRGVLLAASQRLAGKVLVLLTFFWRLKP